MSCPNHSYGVRTCYAHGDWHTNVYFAKCPICGEETDLRCSEEEPLTYGEAKAKEAELLAEKFDADQIAAREAQQANRAEAAALERRITAATATIAYDAEHWIEATFMEVAEWAGLEGDPTAWYRARTRPKPTGAEGYTAS